MTESHTLHASPAAAAPLSGRTTGAELAERIHARQARVGVVGLGAVGLPLAALCVRAGYAVVGFEADGQRRARIQEGRSPLRHLPDALVAELVRVEHFTLAGADDRSAVDALLLCVPTPLDAERRPDLSCVRAALAELAPRLAWPALVVLESTAYPGTTREVVARELRAHGRAPGADVFVAFSPERIDPGRGRPVDPSVPKLVGGLDERSGRLAEGLYGALFDEVVRVPSAEVAEAAKLVENVFRAVNIALVNELKVCFEALDLDVWEVLEAAATKPFGFMKFSPGPGMGGHCIPIDPCYLAWRVRQAGARARFVELADEINRGLPAHVVARTGAALRAHGKQLAGSRILLLGLAYKPEVDVVTESPALRLAELLGAAGAEVAYSDPYVPRGPAGSPDLSHLVSLELSPERLAEFDAVVLATDHAAFDYELLARHAPLVVDTRNALASRLAGAPRYYKA